MVHILRIREVNFLRLLLEEAKELYPSHKTSCTQKKNDFEKTIKSKPDDIG